jgi:hypothetical protein
MIRTPTAPGVFFQVALATVHCGESAFRIDQQDFLHTRNAAVVGDLDLPVGCRGAWRQDLDDQDGIADQPVLRPQRLADYGEIVDIKGVVAVGQRDAGFTEHSARGTRPQHGADFSGECRSKQSVPWHRRRHRRDDTAPEFVAPVGAVIPA